MSPARAPAPTAPESLSRPPWLQQYAKELEEATREALAEQPREQRQDPHQAERRRLTKLVDAAEAKVTRLLDAYTDGALDLPTWKKRREAVQVEAEHARPS